MVRPLFASSLLLLSLCVAHVLGTCSPGFSYRLRTQYSDNGSPRHIYDLTFTNAGSCPILGAQVKIGASGVNIIQSWNVEVNPDKKGFSVTNWATLQPGASYTGAGIITNGDPKLTLNTAPCDQACASSPSVASASSASAASASSSSSSTTSSPSPSLASTSSSPQQSSSCVTVTQTVANSWDTGAQWNGVLRNTGSVAMSGLVLVASTPSRIQSLWPLTSLGNGRYGMPDYAATVAPGGQIQFGYTATGTAQVTFTVEGATCPSAPTTTSSASSTTGLSEPLCETFAGESCPSSRCQVVSGTGYCGSPQPFCITPRVQGTCRTEATCGKDRDTGNILEFGGSCVPATYEVFDPAVPTCAAGTKVCGPNQFCIDEYLYHTCNGLCKPATIGKCYNRSAKRR